jgi:hypothetical protein
LFYFANAEKEAEPISLNGTSWPQVKKYLLAQEQKIYQSLLC